MATKDTGNMSETVESPPKENQQVGLTQSQIDEQIVGPVLQSLSTQLGTIKEEILQEVGQQVDQRLTELEAPKENAFELMGGTHQNPARSPGIREGENTQGSRGISIMRMAGLAAGSPFVHKHQCRAELALHDQLWSYYTERGMKVTPNSLMIPFGSSMIPEDFQQGTKSGQDNYSREDLRQMMLQSVRGADPGRLKHIGQGLGGNAGGKINQAISIFSDANLGIFTDDGLAGEIIELVRKAEVFSRLGVREMTLPPNGEITIARQTGAVTGYWTGESSAITASEPTTGSLVLRAKKAAALVLLPNEIFRFATPDMEAFVRGDMAIVLALLGDLAGLEGTGGTTQPLGIINHTGVTTHVAGTVAANGNTFEPYDPGAMIAAVEELNHDVDGRGWGWVMRGKMWRNLTNRRAAAITAGDQDGNFLFAVNREDITKGVPGALEGYSVVKSSQVSNTRTKGSGTDLTYVLGGIPDEAIIARIGVLEFAVATQGDTTFNQDQTKLRAIEHMDFGLRHQDAWVYTDTIDIDLPAGVI